MGRRKYDYPDRKGYHEELKKKSTDGINKFQAITALMNDRVEWFEETKEGHKIGWFANHYQSRVIITWVNSEGEQQLQDVEVAFEWADRILRKGSFEVPKDLYEIAEKVRKKTRKHLEMN